MKMALDAIQNWTIVFREFIQVSKMLTLGNPTTMKKIWLLRWWCCKSLRHREPQRNTVASKKKKNPQDRDKTQSTKQSRLDMVGIKYSPELQSLSWCYYEQILNFWIQYFPILDLQNVFFWASIFWDKLLRNNT